MAPHSSHAPPMGPLGAGTGNLQCSRQSKPPRLCPHRSLGGHRISAGSTPACVTRGIPSTGGLCRYNTIAKIMRGRLVDKAGPPALAKHRGVNTALRPLVEQKSLCDSLSRHKTEAEPAHLASSRQPRVLTPSTHSTMSGPRQGAIGLRYSEWITNLGAAYRTGLSSSGSPARVSCHPVARVQRLSNNTPLHLVDTLERAVSCAER